MRKNESYLGRIYKIKLGDYGLEVMPIGTQTM